MSTINLPGQPSLSMLDAIPWVELSHAYGVAIDVPGQLRTLLNPDARKRREVFFSFTGNLCHQGTVYSATVPAIEVLQHLLSFREVPDKAKILGTLAAFAVGFPEDIQENVSLSAVLFGHGAEAAGQAVRVDHSAAKECYLTVAAGAPLYEALLQDDDPRTVISAAHLLSFLPAHAFAACETLLSLAGDAARHDYIRGAGLIACSFLASGGNSDCFLNLLNQFTENEQSNSLEPLPWLSAAATYCLLREKRQLSAAVREHAESLANRCLEHDVKLPVCDFYVASGPGASPDPAQLDVQTLLMPEPQFPWGDLTARIQKTTRRDSAALARRRDKRASRRRPALPNAESFTVKPGVFERENIVAAVYRYHAQLIGDRKNIVEATREFEPFQPYALQAWDEILRLLDSEEIEVRWAAAALLEKIGPLDESAVDALIERLHANNNSGLCRTILSQKITPRQCEDLCRRLRQGDFVRSRYSSNRDDYRVIVMQHGTSEQLWSLFETGEDPERSSAGHALLGRKLLEASDPRIYATFSADLLANDYGRAIQAKLTFAQSEPAQRWFFNHFDSLPTTQQFAVAEAMETFRADLSPLVDDLWAKVQNEENPVVQARLISLFKSLSHVDERLVDRLASLTGDNHSALTRGALVRVFGHWLDNPTLRPHLARVLNSLLTDASPRVRRGVLEQLATRHDFILDGDHWFRLALTDSDAGNVLYAMWSLAARHQLNSEDLRLLLSVRQIDRVTAETLIALTLQPQVGGDMIGFSLPQFANRPLTASVLRWRQSLATASG